MKRTPLPRLAGFVLSAAVALSFATAAQAQWKWRDKGGQIHLSDLPPPSDVPDKDVLQRPNQNLPAKKPATPAPAASGAVASADKPRTDPELEARLRRAEQEKQALQKKDEERQAAARAENCTRARDYLRTLESGVRLSRVNEKGEREVYDDRMRAEETQKARNAIASECK